MLTTFVNLHAITLLESNQEATSALAGRAGPLRPSAAARCDRQPKGPGLVVGHTFHWDFPRADFGSWMMVEYCNTSFTFVINARLRRHS